MNLKHWKINSAIIIIILCTFIAPIINHYLKSILGTTISVISITTFIIFIADKLLIKIPVINKLLFSVPYIKGRYQGHIIFINPQTKVEDSKSCYVEIKQNGSKIDISSFFEKKHNDSVSHSISEVITKKKNDNFQLIFTYLNEGGNHKDLPAHYGTNVLDIILNQKKVKLKGIYYTDKNPQTKGKMTLEFQSRKLKGEY